MLAGQRHSSRTMFENPFVQFAVELLRTLFIDELSERVRPTIVRRLVRRHSRDVRRAFLRVHRRNRDRLIHRLLADIERDL